MPTRAPELVLGIDPGTASMGISLVKKIGHSLKLVAYDCIHTSAKLPAPERLAILYRAINAAIKKFKPRALAVEKIFFSKNVKTAISVAQARGIVLLSAAQAKIETFEYNPQQVKQAVTGWGSADKKQVQEMVRRILGLKEIPKPDDAADAIAVAICHLNTNRRLSNM
jgi:crossover junction endodeoxyribonuclease RuvC